MAARPVSATCSVRLWKSATPASVRPKSTKSRGTGPSITGFMPGFYCTGISFPHERRDYLRGRPEGAREEARAAHVLRVQRHGVLDREHVPREPGGFPDDQVAPARGLQHRA